MTTNQNNAIGTNAAYSGRTSVNAFNDDLAAYSRGILTGWNCQVDTGLTVILGGGHSVRDVAIAEDNAGNKTTINNISLDEVPVTLDTAPGANSRIDAIVAYVDNPPQGSNSTADNPEACGIIPVAGTPAVSPQAPDDNAIRTAITADGASGTTAYYVVLATVTVPTGTTDLIPGYIQQGDKSVLNTNQIADSSITSSKIDFTTLGPGDLHTEYGSITSTTTITPPIDGYLCFKSVIFRTQAAASGSCYVTDENGTVLAGIPYAEVAKGQNDANLQFQWAIPVSKSRTYTLQCSGYGQFQSVVLRGKRYN